MSVIVSNNKRSISCPISQYKTSNFLTNIMIRDEADLTGAHEVILLNTEGDVRNVRPVICLLSRKNRVLLRRLMSIYYRV